VSSQDVQRVAESEELDIVDELAPSETEEEPTRNFSIRGAGNVGAPATLESFSLHRLERKTHEDGNTPGSTGTLAESRSGQAALREQWERLEQSHCRKSRATRT
jgi:hypothetical protein